jgi:5'-nucleotidase
MWHESKRLRVVLGWTVGLGLAAHGCTSRVEPGPASQAEAVQRSRHVSSCQDHDDHDDHEEKGDVLAVRARAYHPVHWRKSGDVPADRQVHVKLLGINDFHGQLSPKTVASRPAGGAAVLASYLKTAANGGEDATFIVHAGDHVGASPPSSALLQDEPSISFLSMLANQDCKYQGANQPKCNMVGTLGNHEFDEGKNELLRLLQGGNHPNGPFLEKNWRGARYPYVNANVVDEVTGKPILPPYVIKRLPGAAIAFIGAVLRDTPSIVVPTGVAGLQFLDEAEAINSYIPELHALGVHTIVVLIHQGLTQPSYEGPTSSSAGAPTGALLEVISRLHDDIDVIVSGHTHQFSNALIANAHGVPMLVTQAFSASTAYDDIDLVIDTKSNDVIAKSAQIVTTWGDSGPGLWPTS